MWTAPAGSRSNLSGNLALLFYLALGARGLAAVNGQNGGALVVLSVEAGSLGERAGLLRGDVLEEWRRSAAPPASPFPGAGRLASPFDLQEVLVEEAPRGAVTLVGRRGQEARTWTLVAGASAERAGLTLLPELPPELGARLEAGRAAFAAGSSGEGSAGFRAAAERAFALRRPDAALWFLRERAFALVRSRDFPAADRAFAAVLAPLAASGARAATSDLLVAWGRSFDERGLWHEAELRFVRALADSTPVDGGSVEAGADLRRARALHGLGEVYRHSDDYERARPAHEGALALRRLWAPRSLDCAESLFALARTRAEVVSAASTGAEGLLRAAESMSAGIEAGGLFQARLLDYLGTMVWNEGRIFEGERLLEEAHRIAVRRDPKGYEVARILVHWGTSLDRRGDMAGAEARFTQALALWQELPPTVLNRRNLAVTWWTLAYLKASQGDLETAEADARRALEIQEAIQARSMGVADALDILGHVETQRRDFAAGRRHLQRAVGLREELMPSHLGLAVSLQFLGALELAEGKDPAEAERLLRRADAVYATASPVSLSRADGMASLSLAVAGQGRTEEALALAGRSLAIRQSLSPGGLPEAESLHQIGGIHQRAGRAEVAADHLCRAVEIIDRLGDRLAGAQRARASFTVAYASYYFDCVAARLGQGREAEAFRVLEAGRARALLDLFSARDLELSELPPALQRERERLYEEYVAFASRLESASAGGDAAATEALRRDLLENQRRHDDLSVRIRASVPRLAALRYPQPLDLAAARRVLDPGTVLLAFAVGAERSYLFVVRPAGASGPALRVFSLAAGAAELSRRVEEFRVLASDPTSGRGPLLERGGRLFQLLLAPAEPLLEGARRLLIAPDGALYLLPFAALARADGSLLVEWKPVHKVVSATVYAEVRSQREPAAAVRRPLRMGAAGDPEGRGEALPGAVAAPGTERAGGAPDGVAPLRGAREELEAIAALFAPTARVLVGPAATEARVSALAREVDILHLATHAFVDEAVPLNSSLLLAPSSGGVAGSGGSDDGRLEAWEIVEGLRLRASLVTLSACETGLGKEMGGEGLIGLTRAFQFAGARSVLSSLWAIGDGSTARFMPRFYRHLLAGRSKDEALRRAQLDSLRDPGTSHPSVWAAFELIGDYR